MKNNKGWATISELGKQTCSQKDQQRQTKMVLSKGKLARLVRLIIKVGWFKLAF